MPCRPMTLCPTSRGQPKLAVVNGAGMNEPQYDEAMKRRTTIGTRTPTVRRAASRHSRISSVPMIRSVSVGRIARRKKPCQSDRKSVVKGKSADLGGRRMIKKKKKYEKT